MSGEAWGIVILIFILSIIGGLFARMVGEWEDKRKREKARKRQRSRDTNTLGRISRLEAENEILAERLERLERENTELRKRQ